jgi:TM2 domain-containing membrane protein YozV
MQLLPEIPPGEQAAISGIVNNVSEESEQMFAMAYRARRKDETTILLLTLIGFVVIAGVQRFVLGQIGMGLLYLFTAGLCFIGTIIDLVNHKKLAQEFNVKIAQQIAMNINSGNPSPTA